MRRGITGKIPDFRTHNNVETIYNIFMHSFRNTRIFELEVKRTSRLKFQIWCDFSKERERKKNSMNKRKNESRFKNIINQRR
jgi:hypothetical protein